MTTDEIKQALIAIARSFIQQGPGYSQESVVLREAAERLSIGKDLQRQQQLLTAWHDLFHKGILSWGYDIDNPSAPFFHLAQ